MPLPLLARLSAPLATARAAWGRARPGLDLPSGFAWAFALCLPVFSDVLSSDGLSSNGDTWTVLAITVAFVATPLWLVMAALVPITKGVFSPRA